MKHCRSSRIFYQKKRKKIVPTDLDNYSNDDKSKHLATFFLKLEPLPTIRL